MSRTPHSLVLHAHPDPVGSRVNRSLASAVRDLDGVTVRDLALVRRDSGFDVAEEQRLLTEHDTIVLQSPGTGTPCPASSRSGWTRCCCTASPTAAKAPSCTAKTLQVVTSTGGPHESYLPDGHNRFTMSELLRPLEATAHLCGMAFAEVGRPRAGSR